MPKKASKQKKLKRAPGAPKRFKSAFMFYSENRHKQIRNQSHDKKILASEVAKVVSREWKQLTPEEKVVWEAQASKDRDRYYQEKAAYKGPWKIPNVRDPRAPKKPMSAFLAFSNERRKSTAGANPGMGNAEISGFLSRLWKEAPDEIKNQYREREAKERAKFKIAMAEWEKQRSLSDSSSEGGESNSKARPPQPALKQPPQETNMPRVFPPFMYEQQSSMAQCSMLGTSGGGQMFPQSTNQFSMIASTSLDNVSLLALQSQQQLIPLPPVSVPAASLPANAASGYPNNTLMGNVTGNLPTAINQAGMMTAAQRQTGTVNDTEYQSLDPFIETDTGGYLAAFAALEEDGDMSKKPTGSG